MTLAANEQMELCWPLNCPEPTVLPWTAPTLCSTGGCGARALLQTPINANWAGGTALPALAGLFLLSLGNAEMRAVDGTSSRMLSRDGTFVGAINKPTAACADGR